jgi:predicted HicB family RNase H-like nuclease
MKEKKKRFLVDVGHELHADAKKAAVDAGITLSQYILGAIQMRLGMDKREKGNDKEL